MELQRLLSRLQECGVTVKYTDRKLSISGKKENLSPALIEEIKARKDELVAFLANEKTRMDRQRMILPVEKRAYYELSHAQKRLWLIDRFNDSKAVYNIPSFYYITGRLDRVAFEKAFHFMAQRHESLLTTFPVINGLPYQRIHQPGALPIDIRWNDFRHLPDRDARADAFCAEEANAPFDLEKGPLFRVSVILLTDDKYLLAMTIHHIISDGWSSRVFTGEILRSYQAFLDGKAPQLPALSIQYKDYSAWQNARLNNPAVDEMRQYWQQQFEGEIPVLNFPADYSRPAVKTYNGAEASVLLPTPLATELYQFSARHKATIFMTLLALVKAVLYRYTGQSDIIIGSPIAGRNHLDLENQIGLYINTLALRTRFEGSTTFAELLDLVRETSLNAYEGQTYPFDKLIEDIGLARDISRNPLFEVFINVQEMSGHQQNGSGPSAGALSFDNVYTETSTTKFELTFNFSMEPEGIQLMIIYNTDLFRANRINRLLGHFKNMAESILADPNVPLKAIEYLSSQEKRQLLVDFNNTKTAYPQLSVPELFEAQAALTPELEVVKFKTESITYDVFEQLTRKAAHHLRKRLNVAPNDRIALVTERSSFLMTAIWSVIRSGACYIPIDPALPKERIRFILEDSGAKAVLVSGSRDLQDAIPDGCAAIQATELLQAADAESLAPLPVISRQEDLLYIIYTSGSTGQPKGVMLTHRNAIARVKQADYFPIAAGNRSVLITNYSFDMSILDVIGSVLNGACVCVADAEDLLAMSRLSALIINERIDFISISTALFNTLMDTFPASIAGVKKIYFGGEEASPRHAAAALRHAPTAIINLYGPTETTILASVFDCQRLGSEYPKIPIGKPVSNTQVYILDAHLRPVPVGVTGEIYIGGDGVAKGYLNKETLTSERFIENPFVSGERLHKSGDMGSWLSDGNICFEGRRDHQVKIRGYRVEIGEIEAVLLQHPAVRQAIVLVHNENGEKSLAGYYCSDDLTADQAAAYLSGYLPAYMVPEFLLRMDKFPLSVSGKIDRTALPKPAVVRAATSSAPENEAQQRLKMIWEEILQKEDFGIDDNFFSLGGHSLKAFQLQTRATDLFDIEVRITDIFMYPTIRLLSEYIEQLLAKQWSDPAPADDDEIAVEFDLLDNEPSGQVRMFCIPFAGGGKHVFEGLKRNAPDHVQVEAFELPGRGERSNEPFLPAIEDMVDDLYLQLKSKLQSPYVLFGHSMGGLLSYLLIKRIRHESQELPIHFFISSCIAPFLWKQKINLSIVNRQALETAMKNEYKLEGDLLKYTASVLHADIGALDAYQYSETDLLEMPVTLLRGENELIDDEQLREWRALCSQEPELCSFPGDHFYFMNQGAALMDRICEQLKEVVND